jgi:hypothetical protein
MLVPIQNWKRNGDLFHSDIHKKSREAIELPLASRNIMSFGMIDPQVRTVFGAPVQHDRSGNLLTRSHQTLTHSRY